MLCFGFLAPYKGIELVLEAAALAGAATSQVVVAGGEHPRLHGRRRFAAELRDARTATSPGSPAGYPTTTSARWFAAADVAVFPYPKPFASSGALALALAHGTPVLLSPPSPAASARPTC